MELNKSELTPQSLVKCPEIIIRPLDLVNDITVIILRTHQLILEEHILESILGVPDTCFNEVRTIGKYTFDIPFNTNLDVPWIGIMQELVHVYFGNCLLCSTFLSFDFFCMGTSSFFILRLFSTGICRIFCLLFLLIGTRLIVCFNFLLISFFFDCNLLVIGLWLRGVSSC